MTDCGGTRPVALAALTDHSSKPASCPHQMDPEIEARVVEMRRLHPGWEPRTIRNQLTRAGVEDAGVPA